jgi:O-antigen/teichoic acid export membrane protein
MRRLRRVAACWRIAAGSMYPVRVLAMALTAVSASSYWRSWRRGYQAAAVCWLSFMLGQIWEMTPTRATVSARFMR